MEYENGLPYPSDQLGQAVLNSNVYLFGGSEKPSNVLVFDKIAKKFTLFGTLQTMRVGATERVTF